MLTEEALIASISSVVVLLARQILLLLDGLWLDLQCLKLGQQRCDWQKQRCKIHGISSAKQFTAESTAIADHPAEIIDTSLVEALQQHRRHTTEVGGEGTVLPVQLLIVHILRQHLATREVPNSHLLQLRQDEVLSKRKQLMNLLDAKNGTLLLPLELEFAAIEVRNHLLESDRVVPVQEEDVVLGGALVGFGLGDLFDHTRRFGEYGLVNVELRGVGANAELDHEDRGGEVAAIMLAWVRGYVLGRWGRYVNSPDTMVVAEVARGA